MEKQIIQSSIIAEKLQKMPTSAEQSHFRSWKSGKVWLFAGALVTAAVVGGQAASASTTTTTTTPVATAVATTSSVPVSSTASSVAASSATSSATSSVASSSASSTGSSTSKTLAATAVATSTTTTPTNAASTIQNALTPATGVATQSHYASVASSAAAQASSYYTTAVNDSNNATGNPVWNIVEGEVISENEETVYAASEDYQQVLAASDLETASLYAYDAVAQMVQASFFTSVAASIAFLPSNFVGASSNYAAAANSLASFASSNGDVANQVSSVADSAISAAIAAGALTSAAGSAVSELLGSAVAEIVSDNVGDAQIAASQAAIDEANGDYAAALGDYILASTAAFEASIAGVVQFPAYGGHAGITIAGGNVTVSTPSKGQQNVPTVPTGHHARPVATSYKVKPTALPATGDSAGVSMMFAGFGLLALATVAFYTTRKKKVLEEAEGVDFKLK